jgi:nitrate/nitrite transporter NarK
MLGIPVSGVIGSPLSGWILAQMSNARGLGGWQWLFLLEALPTILAGVVCLVLLADGPDAVAWLSAREKQLLAARLAAEHSGVHGERRLVTLFDAFRSQAVWLFSVVFFGFVMGIYGIGFWMPQIISDTLTRSPWKIGLIGAIPWAIGSVAMMAIARHSDATGERRWHIALSGLAGSLAFAASAIPGIPGPLSLAALAVATAGLMGSVPVFWCLPAGILSSSAAAAGIAWINSVGNLAGYVSPLLIGKLVDLTHSMTLPLLMLSAASLVAAVVIACMRPESARAGELPVSSARSID